MQRRRVTVWAWLATPIRVHPAVAAKRCRAVSCRPAPARPRYKGCHRVPPFSHLAHASSHCCTPCISTTHSVAPPPASQSPSATRAPGALLRAYPRTESSRHPLRSWLLATPASKGIPRPHRCRRYLSPEHPRRSLPRHTSASRQLTAAVNLFTVAHWLTDLLLTDAAWPAACTAVLAPPTFSCSAQSIKRAAAAT